MARERARTREALLDAAERIVRRKGAHAAGVNALAAEAGVDKVLIYRYFGGASGLLEALARERPVWPAPPSSAGSATPGGALVDAIVNRARALRANAFSRRALAAELSADAGLAPHVARSREDDLASLASSLRASHQLPPYLDLEALLAILTAGLVHVALHADAGSAFGGVDPRDDRDWRRLERAVTTIVRALLEPSDA